MFWLLVDPLLYVSFLFAVVLYFLFHRQPKARSLEEADLPFVSILVPAKNEALGIERTLSSLNALDYPKNKLEILIGNDDSTDETETVVQNFIADKSHCSLLNITGSLGEAKHKANVLAHLAQRAGGDYFVFVDADTTLPPTYLQTLLQYFKADTGMVGGPVVYPLGKSFIEKMQHVELLLAISVAQLFNAISPVSLQGAGLMIRREAYWDTGGYEALSFSYVEDLQVTQAVLDHDWQVRFVLDPRIVGYTQSLKKFHSVLRQRARWAQGLSQINVRLLPAIIMAVLAVVFVPTVIVVGFYSVIAAVILFITVFVLQSLAAWLLAWRLGIRTQCLAIMLYQPLFFVSIMYSFIVGLLPVRVVWKP